MQWFTAHDQPGALGAGVQWFTAHDQPGALGPGGQVDQVGELGHLGAAALLAVLGEGVAPPFLVVDGPANRGVYLVFFAGDHGEADVAFPAAPHEVGAPRRIGTHLDLAAHKARVVTNTVTDSDLRGQLGDRLIQHSDVIGDCVRPRIARPQQLGETLPGGISEAVDRMKPEPAVVARRRLGLVLRVHLVQRRVDVQHHRRSARRRPPSAATRRAYLGERGAQRAQRVGVDVAEGAMQRRVRRHLPEQVGWARRCSMSLHVSRHRRASTSPG
jgi:hypothetical protein